MKIRIKILWTRGDGNLTEKTVELQKKRVFVGGENADIPLGGESSPIPFVMFFQGVCGELRAMDMNSRTEVRMNEQTIVDLPLDCGDVLHIGRFALVIERYVSARTISQREALG